MEQLTQPKWTLTKPFRAQLKCKLTQSSLTFCYQWRSVKSAAWSTVWNKINAAYNSSDFVNLKTKTNCCQHIATLHYFTLLSFKKINVKLCEIFILKSMTECHFKLANCQKPEVNPKLKQLYTSIKHSWNVSFKKLYILKLFDWHPIASSLFATTFGGLIWPNDTMQVLGKQTYFF